MTDKELAKAIAVFVSRESQQEEGSFFLSPAPAQWTVNAHALLDVIVDCGVATSEEMSAWVDEAKVGF